MPTITIAECIKQGRRRAKITQQQASDRLNMCRDRYIGIESGKGKVSLLELQEILTLFGVKLCEISAELS